MPHFDKLSRDAAGTNPEDRPEVNGEAQPLERGLGVCGEQIHEDIGLHPSSSLCAINTSPCVLPHQTGFHQVQRGEWKVRSNNSPGQGGNLCEALRSMCAQGKRRQGTPLVNHSMVGWVGGLSGRRRILDVSSRRRRPSPRQSSWSQPVRRHTGRRRLQKRHAGTWTVDRSTYGMPHAVAARRLRLARNTLEIPSFPKHSRASKTLVRPRGLETRVGSLCLSLSLSLSLSKTLSSM